MYCSLGSRGGGWWYISGRFSAGGWVMNMVDGGVCCGRATGGGWVMAYVL